MDSYNQMRNVQGRGATSTWQLTRRASAALRAVLLLLLTALSLPLGTAVQAAPIPAPVADRYDGVVGQVLDVAAPGVLANDGVSGVGVEVVRPPRFGTVTPLPNGGFRYTPTARAPRGQYRDAWSYRWDNGSPGSATVSLVLRGRPAVQPAATVHAWGSNWDGRSTVPPDLGDVVAVAAGIDHSLALQADGTVRAWGRNWDGQTNVPGDLTNVVAIAAGEEHSLALQADGTMRAWGRNWNGQATVPPDLGDVVAVAAGIDHSLALQADGTVSAWGSNHFGQGTVPAGLSNVVAIAGGRDHNLALLADGTVRAWGSNWDGQTNVPGDLTNVVAIAAGANHSLALQADGTVRAWGRNWNGQATVPPDLGDVVAVAAGIKHSLALQADGTVRAWGYNNHGQATVPGDLNNVVDIAAGDVHSLALVVSRPGPPSPLTLVSDWSGYNRPANCSGSTCPARVITGKRGSAARFDGTNDQLRVAGIDLANQSFTVSAWVKRASTTGHRWLVSQGTAAANQGLHIGFDNYNNFRCNFFYNDLAVSAGTSTTWQHWTCTYDAQTRTRTIYRDGVRVAQDIAPAHYGGSGELVVGSWTSNTSYFQGDLDELTIHRTALSAAQVQQLYNGGQGADASEVVAAGLRLFQPYTIAANLRSDWSGNNRTASCSGDNCPALLADGKRGSAARFDGTNDQLRVAGIDLANKSFTVSAWVKRASTSGHRWLVSQGTAAANQGLHIGFADGWFRCNFFYNDLAVSAGTSTTWQHWTCTYDAQTRTRTIYRDGVRVAQDIAPAHYGGSGELVVGSWTSNTSYFQGDLDELAVHTTALSAAQVQQLYHGGQGADATDVASVGLQLFQPYTVSTP